MNIKTRLAVVALMFPALITACGNNAGNTGDTSPSQTTTTSPQTTAMSPQTTQNVSSSNSSSETTEPSTVQTTTGDNGVVYVTCDLMLPQLKQLKSATLWAAEKDCVNANAFTFAMLESKSSEPMMSDVEDVDGKPVTLYCEKEKLDSGSTSYACAWSYDGEDETSKHGARLIVE